MESLMKPVTLSQDVSKVLDEIRAGAENALYGAGPDVSEELFAKHVVSLVEGAGLPVLQTMHYRWFLRELARLWRTRTGRDLAFHLELCIRKWVGLGLEPKTLQFLVCEAHERLKAQSLTTKTQRHEEPGGDMTGLSDNTDRVPSPEPDDERRTINDGTLPGIMAGPRPPARGPEDPTTKTQRHKADRLEPQNPGTPEPQSSIALSLYPLITRSLRSSHETDRQT